jgi:hypothetical protein
MATSSGSASSEFGELLTRLIAATHRRAEARLATVETSTEFATAARDFADHLEQTPGLPPVLATAGPRLRKLADDAEQRSREDRDAYLGTAEFIRVLEAMLRPDDG